MVLASKKTPSTSRTTRGRGPYNVACDVCKRKKVKCDGIQPVCQPCHSQGRQKECTWTKNSVRKSRSDPYVEAVHKQEDIFRKSNTEMCNYVDYLESMLKKNRIDFRASRPADPDVLMGQPEDDADCVTGGEDDDQGPVEDHGNHGTIMAICIPPQSLQIEPFTQPSRFPALAENKDDTYVLLVDGVSPSQRNLTFEWSRHLAPNEALDRQSHDKALDLLFKFHTAWCLRIVPGLFLRDMHRALSIPPTHTPPKTPHYSPMLHNALIALALAFMDGPLKDLKTRQRYASHAKSFIEAECRKPNLSVVHALSVLASFHSSQGDQTLGYMYFGMSARISQALGLNQDCSEWVKLGLMDESERLDRHWTSWTNFTQDVCWSLYVGRDFCVAEPTAVPCIDAELDEISWFYAPAGIGPQPNNLTKTFEATCRLLTIARRIMDVLNGLKKARSRPLILDGLVGDIDVELNVWKSSLVEELDITPRSLLMATPHKLMLHLAYWWLLILLHRPFFQRTAKPIRRMDREIDHVKSCVQAAEHIMELLLTWRNLYTLRYCPVTLIQTAFSAGTVYLLLAMQASSGARLADSKDLRHALGQETLLQQYLQEVGLSWNSATNVSKTLRNLRKEQIRPLLDLLDQRNVPHAPAGPSILPDEEEENDSRSGSRSSSRRRSSTNRRKSRQVSKPPPASAQSSVLAPPNHILTFPTSSNEVPSAPANPSNSPATIISSPSSTLAGPSVSIAIQSETSTSSTSPDSWGLPPSSGSSSNFNFGPSFAHRDSFDYMDNPFSGNGSSEDVGHPIGDEGSSHHIQRSSSRNHSVGYLGMLGGQTLLEEPALVGFWSEVLRPAFLNQGSASSSGDLGPSSSHDDKDSMDLDNVPWRRSFAS